MNLSMRAQDLIVEITAARRLPLMSRVAAAERLTEEAALLILELAKTVDEHAARFDALLEGLKKINAALDERIKRNA